MLNLGVQKNGLALPLPKAEAALTHFCTRQATNKPLKISAHQLNDE
jgi:hypothetical protein